MGLLGTEPDCTEREKGRRPPERHDWGSAGHRKHNVNSLISLVMMGRDELRAKGLTAPLGNIEATASHRCRSGSAGISFGGGDRRGLTSADANKKCGVFIIWTQICCQRRNYGIKDSYFFTLGALIKHLQALFRSDMWRWDFFIREKRLRVLTSLAESARCWCQN